MANRTVDDRTEMPCTRCGQIRPVSKFYIKTGYRGNKVYSSWCKMCSAEDANNRIIKKRIADRQRTLLSVFSNGGTMCTSSVQESPCPLRRGKEEPSAAETETSLQPGTDVEGIGEESPALTGTPLEGGEESPVQESPRCKRCVHYSLIRHKCKNKLCDFDEFLGYAMPCEI